ncbi:MAG: type II secretion system protein [Candidatus Niyogibacteria bacterium]|nr:type II secretion system protein [Candidatus Niyogibacteria bacterium]
MQKPNTKTTNQRSKIEPRQSCSFSFVVLVFGIWSLVYDKRRAHKSGFSMVEMVIYLAILVSFSVFTVNTIITISAAWNDFRALQTLNASMHSALERITREARYASTTDAVLTTLNTHPGRLVLKKTDLDTGLVYSEDFYLNGTRLAFKEDDGAEQFLTTADVAVTNLIFRQYDNSNVSKTIKAEFTAYSSKNPAITRNFYLTAIMRGSY